MNFEEQAITIEETEKEKGTSTWGKAGISGHSSPWAISAGRLAR